MRFWQLTNSRQSNSPNGIYNSETHGSKVSRKFPVFQNKSWMNYIVAIKMLERGKMTALLS